MKLLTQNLKSVKKYYNVTLWLSCNEHQQLARTLGDFATKAFTEHKGRLTQASSLFLCMDMLKNSDYVLIVPKSTHKTGCVLQQVF